ncbi:MAG: hypothetical protein AAFW84_30165 [Cyanobacteria bacterium J06635_15]
MAAIAFRAMIALPPIYFYLPPSQWPSDWPQSPSENWPGFGLGIYAWTLQTYLHLAAAGVPCQLVDQIPEAGIVFAHSNSFRVTRPRPRLGQSLLLVCLKAEEPAYAHGQLHVVQNRAEANGHNRIFLPHWPQPGLIKRDPQRGDRFETVAFLGHRDSLAPELEQPEWQNFVESLNLHWQPVVNVNHWSDYGSLDARWHDYRHLDAIIAVRSFNRRYLKQQQLYRYKPPTKLYNAWLAGVPAILGQESAFRSERQHPLDYLEVSSLNELKAALVNLKADVNLRRQMSAQGHQRAEAIAPEQITVRWIAFLQSVALPAYDRWYAQPRWRQSLRLQRSVGETLVEKAQRRLRSRGVVLGGAG